MLSDNLIWLRHQFHKHLIGTVLPISWFGPKPPCSNDLTIAESPIHLEIVSHCWQYSHMLNFQLSSLVNFPPSHVKLTYTLYHAAEDADLKTLIARYDALDIPNITWNWVEVPKNQLFRRAIGRNRTALNTKADWVWYSDCDLIFHEHCLDSLGKQLHNLQTPLVFPEQEFITDLLAADHAMLNQSTQELIDIDKSLFHANAIHKAKGAFQIVHGDVLRTCGYCRDIKLYQTPMPHWSKTFEDTMFRRMIASEGIPIDIPGLYRIRHIEKGRYTKDTQFTKVRKRVRSATDDQGS